MQGKFVMEKCKLGLFGIYVVPFCLGGNVFGWMVDEKIGFVLLDVFVEVGFGFIDIVDVYLVWVPGYVGGESESMIGVWMVVCGNCDKFIIVIRVGIVTGKQIGRAHV